MKIHVVFDGPPGHEAGRFVEVENDEGKGIAAGEWKEREDGLWELIINTCGYFNGEQCMQDFVRPERNPYNIIKQFRECWRGCPDDKKAARDCTAWELVKKLADV